MGRFPRGQGWIWQTNGDIACADYSPPSPREDLLISWDPTRWREMERSSHGIENDEIPRENQIR